MPIGAPGVTELAQSQCREPTLYTLPGARRGEGRDYGMLPLSLPPSIHSRVPLRALHMLSSEDKADYSPCPGTVYMLWLSEVQPVACKLSPSTPQRAKILHTHLNRLQGQYKEVAIPKMTLFP